MDDNVNVALLRDLATLDRKLDNLAREIAKLEEIICLPAPAEPTPRPRHLRLVHSSRKGDS